MCQEADTSLSNEIYWTKQRVGENSYIIRSSVRVDSEYKIPQYVLEYCCEYCVISD